MTILLVRHGETALNAARVLQPPDTPLSARGSAQAQAVGQRLLKEPIAAILSSDLKRAYDTAAPLASARGMRLRTSALLQERNFGDLRGKAYDDLDFNPFETDGAPPNGESVPAFLARVALAFQEALALRAQLDGPLVLFTHGLVIKAILQHHVRLAAGIEVPERVGNTSVSMFDPQAPHAVTMLNCVAHLEGKLLEDGSSLSGG